MDINNHVEASGNCCNCGKCCSDVLLITKEEEIRIKKYIRENNIKVVNRNSILSNTQQVNICPFLNKDNKCNIYEDNGKPIRPEICQNFLCSQYFKEKEKIQDYTKVKVVSMMQTFFPEIFLLQPIDVTDLQKIFAEKLKKLQEKK